MKCTKCDSEISDDPYAIGEPKLQREDEFYGTPLCENCYNSMT